MNRDASSQFRGIWGYAWMISDVRITRIRRGNPRGTDGVYATTVHELAHASHYRGDMPYFIPLIWDNERDLIVESWAECVETVATNRKYDALNGVFFNEFNNRGWQRRLQRETLLPATNPENDPIPRTEMDEYTPVFYDMLDDYNQMIRITTWPDLPDDNVRDYSVNQVWNSVRGARSLNEIGNRLQNFNNPTSNQVNTLIDQYELHAAEL